MKLTNLQLNCSYSAYCSRRSLFFNPDKKGSFLFICIGLTSQCVSGYVCLSDHVI